MMQNQRPSPLFIAFISAMCLLIILGVFLVIYGSLHHVPATPRLPGDGLFARLIRHV